MKPYILLFGIFFMFGIKTNAQQIETLTYGSFGKITVYKPTGVPKSFILFISGDGGWNKGARSMAKNIASQGAMVAGIDITAYFRNIKKSKVKCYYPAGDLESLSMEIQKKYKSTAYSKPILVGYSAGATLAYGALAQSPANTFKGVIAMGFCPNLELDKTLCGGQGLTTKILKPGKSFYLNPSEKLYAPFIVLQGIDDQVCPYPDAVKYMKEVNTEQMVTLPKVGHGFSVARNWLPQFIIAYDKILSKPVQEKNLKQVQSPEIYKNNLPIAVVPAMIKNDLPMAFIISGDGGWTSFDQKLAEQFAKKGIAVIGLDAQDYFWNAKTPKESAAEFSKCIEHYLKQWDKKTLILLGYSFGASAIPFIADSMDPQLKENIKGVYCLSPDETADFEIHVLDMININSVEKYNVINEINKIKFLDPVCFFGNEENESVRKKFEQSGINVVLLPGNHHFNNDFDAIADTVLKEYKSSISRRR